MTDTKKSDLQFDEESHVYKLGDRILPSVTQVINSILPGWQADEWYLQRGTATHYGCQLLDEDRLDWRTVAPEISGRLRAWESFRADFKGKVIESELAIAHPVFGFAGRLDRVIVNGTGELIICDIKASISKQVKLQLSAYKNLYEQSHNGSGRISKGVAVGLSDDGKYTTLWMDKKELEFGVRTFLSALTVYNFKIREGI